MTLSLLILATVAAIGVAALVRGWVGDRTDDHPICRKCGFDLFGLPAGAQRCSECGVDLSRPRALRSGHRMKRKALLWAGTVLLLVSVTVLTALGWARSTDFNPNPWKPVGWLVSEASGSSPLVRAAALRELLRRLIAGELNADQTMFVADAALAHQADRIRVWVPQWGEFVETAWEAGQLPADRWERYVQQAGELSVEFRSPVRRGDLLPLRLQYAPARLAPSRRKGWHLRQDVRCTGMTIKDVKVGPFGRWSMVLGPDHSGSMQVTQPLVQAAFDQLPEGPHNALVHLEISVREYGPGDSHGTERIAYATDVSGTFELAPATVETVKVVRGSGADTTLRRGISVQVWDEPEKRLRVVVEARDDHAQMAHEVIARAGGEEVKAGEICGVFRRGGKRVWVVSLVEHPGERIDVILRPSADVARKAVDVFEIAAEDTVFEAPVINARGAAAAPARGVH